MKIILTNGNTVASFSQDDQIIKIGREDDNDLVLDEVGISRYHAEIILQGGTMILRDLDSYNGINLNGKRVTETTIFNYNDKIKMGNITYSFLEDMVSPAAQAQKTPESEDHPLPVIKRQYILAAFLVIAFMQLAIPFSQIYANESVLVSGKDFKFKTIPIDPYDFFRGKYVTLRFPQSSISVTNISGWHINDNVYLLISKNSQGYAQIIGAQKSTPVDSTDYILTKVTRVIRNNSIIYYKLPFNRYYMEESKALPAEKIVRRNQRRNNTYALVKIKNGQALLKDVIVNEQSLKDLVKEAQSRNPR